MSIAIIGGGLSGWAAAYRLFTTTMHPLNIHVIEASDIMGGRAKSMSGVDVGGAWIWPSNPLARHLLDELNVPYFRDTMALSGEVRLENGMVSLVHAMEDKVRSDTNVCNLQVHTSTRITRIDVRQDNEIDLFVNDKQFLQVNRVIVAIPPRLLARSITFNPPFQNRELSKALLKQNTWMASIAKVYMKFSTPWWKSGGRSINRMRADNRAIFQLMDASTSSVNAIVAFALPPPFDIGQSNYAFSTSDLASGANSIHQYLQSITKSIQRLAQQNFALTEANWKSNAIEVGIQSWQHDPLVFSTDGTHGPGHQLYYHHPYDGPDMLREPIQFSTTSSPNVVLAGSETDDEFPGFIEGALRSGFRAADLLPLDP